jgi:pSer/pThr/pTyr-binding forkhead associated (FHA) protein
VFQEGSVIIVEDLGSKNGTLVNGEKISGRYELKIDDTIQVGMVTLCLKGGS